MIDLVRKIQAEKDAVPKCKVYRTKRPLFSHSTIKIFRCVIDNPGIISSEVEVKAEVSRAHATYSLLEFYKAGLLSRENGKTSSGVLHKYSVAGSVISAREIALKEEARLNTPNITGRMEEIVNLISLAGQCTADRISKHLGVRNQNARAYIKKLLRIGMISRVDSKIKGTKYEYSIKVAA